MVVEAEAFSWVACLGREISRPDTMGQYYVSVGGQNLAFQNEVQGNPL